MQGASPYEMNRLALPGDILLLWGRSKNAALNTGGQTLRRLSRAKYTHVALVINMHVVAEAMPGDGVRVKKWREVEGAYDLERCCVARNRELASRPQMAAKVLSGAMYYVRQPYKLWALLTTRDEVANQAGLVCSQFIAAVFKDLGLPLGTPLGKALPIDIDRATRESANWRQFPMSEYGIRTGYSEPDSILPSIKALTQEMNERLVQVVPTMSETSQAITRLDELMLGITELFIAAAGGTAEMERAAALITSQLREPMSTGAEQLDAWKALFLDERQEGAAFLHDVDRAQNRERWREAFAKSIVQLNATGRQQLDGLGDFSTRVRELIALAQRGLFTYDLANQAREYAQMINQTGTFLFSDNSEEVEQRLAGYDAIQQELEHHAKKSGMKIDRLEQARESLIALGHLDRMRVHWITDTAPAVKQCIDVFTALQEQLLSDKAPQAPTANR